MRTLTPHARPRPTLSARRTLAVVSSDDPATADAPVRGVPVIVVHRRRQGLVTGMVIARDSSREAICFHLA